MPRPHRKFFSLRRTGNNRWLLNFASRFGIILLKPLACELESPAIFPYRAHHVVWCAVGHFRLDFQGNLYFGTYQPDQVGNHLVRNASGVATNAGRGQGSQFREIVSAGGRQKETPMPLTGPGTPRRRWGNEIMMSWFP